MYVTKKDMCFVRKLDDIGRITIPRDVRNTYDLNPGDSVEILCGENDMRVENMNCVIVFLHQVKKSLRAFIT